MRPDEERRIAMPVMNNPKWYLVLLMVVFIICTGCTSSYRPVPPDFEGIGQRAADLKSRIPIRIVDRRERRDESEAILTALQEGLQKTYPKSLIIQPERVLFERAPLALQLKVDIAGTNFTGLNFDSARTIINRELYRTKLRKVSDGVYGWADTYAKLNDSGIEDTPDVSIGAHWIGTTWLVLEVIDRRSGAPTSVEFPIAAQVFKQNWWGFMTASAAAQESWQRCLETLYSVIDAVIEEADRAATRPGGPGNQSRTASSGQIEPLGGVQEPLADGSAVPGKGEIAVGTVINNLDTSSDIAPERVDLYGPLFGNVDKQPP